MKAIGKMWVIIVSMTLLGWMTACAGSNGMMDDKMDNQSQNMTDSKSKGMMEDKMDDKSGSMMDDKGGAMAGDKAMMDKPMMPAREAMLKGSDGHHAAGTVTFGMGMNNHQTLTLTDIKVDKVPDGYVYLTKGADRMHGVVIGMLKQFSGTVSFDLPAEVKPEDYDSVVIWCKKFNVEIGRAYFHKKTM